MTFKNDLLSSSVKLILNSYEKLLNLNENDINEIGKTIPIPFFPSEIIHNLCEDTLRILQKK